MKVLTPLGLIFRQERLEQLAEKFERKAGLREGWLQDMNIVLDDMNIGTSASQVELAAKRHETITTEVLARVRTVVWKELYW